METKQIRSFYNEPNLRETKDPKIGIHSFFYRTIDESFKNEPP